LIYAGTGIATMLAGKAAATDGHDHGESSRTMANFLDYGALDHHFLPGLLPHGQHLGIFLVEFGVGVTVTAVMTMIFYCFAGRHPDSNQQTGTNE